MNWASIIKKCTYGLWQGGLAAFMVYINDAPHWGCVAVFLIVALNAQEHI